MPASNGYVTNAEARLRGGFERIPDTTLDALIEAASRAIDEHCGRRFYLDAEPSARTFVCRDRQILDLAGQDIGLTAGVIVKTGPGDGTFPTTHAAGTWQLEPVGGIVGGIEGHAYTRVRALTFALPVDVLGRPCVQITARWGWPDVPRTVQHICHDLVRRATFQETGLQSESTGSYQVAYDFVGLRNLLNDGQKALLAPYARVLA